MHRFTDDSIVYREPGSTTVPVGPTRDAVAAHRGGIPTGLTRCYIRLVTVGVDGSESFVPPESIHQGDSERPVWWPAG